LLLHAGAEGIPARRLGAAADELVRTLAAQARGRAGPDVMEVLYAALQLAEHRRDDPDAQDALRKLLRELRLGDARQDGIRHWTIGHHTLVMRLLAAHYGEAGLARNIAALFLRKTERDNALEVDAFHTELKAVIRERVMVELGAIQELSGGHTDAQIYRVPFRYWYPMPGSKQARYEVLNGTHTASVIVKRSTNDAFHAATESYRHLPEELREYFVRQPEESQIFKSDGGS